MRHPSFASGARRLGAVFAVGAVVLGGLVALPTAAHAAEITVDDVVFDWGLNNESGGGAYFGGCNFLSAGVAGDTGSSRVWTQNDGFYSTASGNTTVVKPTSTGELVQPTWATKCQTPAGTTVNTTAASYSGNRVQIANGTGSIDLAANTASIAWDGSFSVVYYGGMTYWTVSDPELTVDADGTGTLVGTASGYGADMDDPEKWVPLESTEITLATFSGLELTASGISATPDYLGVEVEAAGTAQTRTGANWGSFPQSFVDYQQQTGQSSYWYSSGGMADAKKPATAFAAVWDAAPAITAQPGAQSVGLGATATFSVVAERASGYQWQSANAGTDTWADIAGATSATYAVTGTSAAAAKIYRAVVSGDGGQATSDAATLTVDVPTPTVTVSKTSDIDPEGETVTVTGSGFLPNGSATNGTRPPLAGVFTGSYVTFGRFPEVWKPSSGAGSSARPADGTTTKWGVLAAQMATIGGPSRGAIEIQPDGTFETTLTLTKDYSGVPSTGNYGVYTYPGGGASYAAFETYTPITFAVPVPSAPDAPTLTRGEEPRSATVVWTAPASDEPITGYDVTLTPATGDPLTQSVAADVTEATFTALAPGAVYTASVVARNAGGASSASAASQELVVPALLSDVALTGSAVVGKTLTATADVLDGATVTGYAWYAGETLLADGAEATELRVPAAAVGAAITVVVTATATGYDPASVRSEATSPVQEGTLVGSVPTIDGTPQVGVRLYAKVGSWTSGAARTYQWYADGVAIPGATAYSYVVAAPQLGDRITFAVTGSAPGYTTLTRTSAATSAVVSGSLSAGSPRISGTAKVGTRLTAVPGSWTAGTTLSYQWYANGKAIAGATSSTFVPAAAQKGTQISVTVRGTKTGYRAETAGSAKTSKVVAGTLTAGAPRIGGDPKTGKTLTSNPGTWTSGTTVRYQWLANGKPISGATSSKLVLTSALKGKVITIKITGTKAGYTTRSATSASSVTVR